MSWQLVAVFALGLAASMGSYALHIWARGNDKSPRLEALEARMTRVENNARQPTVAAVPDKRFSFR